MAVLKAAGFGLTKSRGQDTKLPVTEVLIRMVTSSHYIDTGGSLKRCGGSGRMELSRTHIGMMVWRNGPSLSWHLLALQSRSEASTVCRETSASWTSSLKEWMVKFRAIGLSSNAKTLQTTRRAAKSGELAALGGWINLTITDDGIVRWDGDAHNSGMDDYDYALVGYLNPRAGSGMPQLISINQSHVKGHIIGNSGREDPWYEVRRNGFLVTKL